MSELGIAEAHIVALFMELVAWGVLIVGFAFFIKVFLFTGELNSASPFVWAMSIIWVLGFLVTIYNMVLIGLYHNIVAFVLYTGDGGAAEELINMSDWVDIMETVDVLIATVLGDGMLIYHCWVILGHSLLVLVPSVLLWISCTGLGMAVIYLASPLHARVLLSASKLQHLIKGYWACTIALNIITTGTMVWRLWRVERMNRRSGLLGASGMRSQSLTRYHQYSGERPSKTMDVAFTLIESGMIYTVTTFISFVSYICNSNVIYGVSSIEIRAVGIAFNLIIVRSMPRQAAADFRISSAFGGTRSTSGTDRWRVKINTTSPKTDDQLSNRNPAGDKSIPMEVVVSRDMANDGDSDLERGSKPKPM